MEAGARLSIADDCETDAPGGPPPQPTGQENATNQAPFSRLQFPPWIEPLPSSLNFYQGDFTVAVPAGIGAVVPVVSFTVPSNQVGYCQNLTQYILTPLDTMRLMWTLTINGGPVAGFDSLLNPPLQARALYIPLGNLRVRLTPGTRLALTITNLSGVACTAGGEIGGWYHDQLVEQQAWGKI